MRGDRVATLALLVACAVLGGCAGTVKGDCAALAGPGWTLLSSPPAEAPQLLQQLNLPPDADQIVWFTRGPAAVLVCSHGFGLVNPACGGSTGYQYEKVDGRWQSRGVLLPTCNRGIE